MLETPSTSKECFSLTSKCLETVNIYDSTNGNSDNGLSQLSGEKARKTSKTGSSL